MKYMVPIYFAELDRTVIWNALKKGIKYDKVDVYMSVALLFSAPDVPTTVPTKQSHCYLIFRN